MSDQPDARLSFTETKITTTSPEPSIYANVNSVAISTEEIVVRYGLMNPENPAEAVGLVRVYMTPGHVKRLAKSLNDALGQYEALFGVIKSPEELLTPEAREHLKVSKK